ncbi:MAG: hypothetical protein P8Z70_00015, partial [Desulfuromonadales bacterium]
MNRFWLSMNGNLSISEFSDIAYDPLNDIVTGGAQDVGNQMQSAPDSSAWDSVMQGDGNTNLIGIDRSVNPNVIYRYSVGNSLHSIQRIEFDQAGVEQGRRNLEIRKDVLNGYDSDFDGFDEVAGAVNPVDGNRLVLAFTGIYESTDNGLTWQRVLEQVGKDKDDRALAVAYGTTDAGGNFIYVSNDLGEVFKYDIAASQEVANTRTKPFDGNWAIDLVVDPEDPDVVYAISSSTIKVSADSGVTWDEIAAPADVELVSLELVREHGADLQIVDRDGTAITVVLAGAKTAGNVVDLINRQTRIAGLNITAQLENQHIRLDTTHPGPGWFGVIGVAWSNAAEDLGLNKWENGQTITGDDHGFNLTGNTLLSAMNAPDGVSLSEEADDILLIGTNRGIYYAKISPALSYPNSALPGTDEAAKGATAYIDDPNAGENRVVISSFSESTDYNGVTVRMVNDPAHAPAVSWDPAARILEFKINDGVTTAADIIAALNEPADGAAYNARVASRLFEASLVAAGVMHETSEVMSGGVNRNLEWQELGQKLPNAQVVDIDYTPVTTYNNDHAVLRGDTLTVGTRGRGTWKITDFMANHFEDTPALIINGTAATAETISLVLNDNRPWMVDVYYDSVRRASYDLAGISRIAIIAAGGNNTFQIDARIQVAGSIAINGGDGGTTSVIEIFGTGVHQAPENNSFHDDASRSGYLLVTGGDGLFIEYRNVSRIQTNFGLDQMKHLKAGLESLSTMDDINNTLGRDAIPLVGRSLSSAVTGAPPAYLPPIGLPMTQAWQQSSLRTSLAAQGLSMDDLQGGGSIIGRFLNSGPLGNFVKEIGDAITDYEVLRTVLDDLDDIPDNVSFTATDSTVTFDMQLEGSFAGGGEIDVNGFDGKLSLRGEVVYSFDIALHLVFGVDAGGFFIDTVRGAEVTVTNLNLHGTVEAQGQLGFLQVFLTGGTVAVDTGVSVSIAFQDPADDPLTDDPHGILRLHEFENNSIFDILSLGLSGSPTADDLVFSGNFGVAALLPSLSSAPFTIAEAGLVFTWADIVTPEGNPNPFGFTIEGTNATGNLLAEFLNLDFEQYILDLLKGVEDVGDSINDLSPLDTDLPLINTSINHLFTGDPYKIGDLLKLHDPVKNYFDQVDAEGGFPKLNEFLEILIKSTDEKMQGSALGASLQYNDGNPELTFGIGASITPEFLFDFDLGPALADIGLDTSVSAKVYVKGDFKAYITFGLDLNKIINSDPSISDSVFFELNNVSADVELSVFDIDLGADFGFLQAEVENAAFRLLAGASLKLTDPDERVTLTELSSGSFFDLFTIEFDDIEVQMGVNSVEVFVGAGRDLARGEEGTGVLVNVEDFGVIVFGKFSRDEATGKIQPPTFSYALTGLGSGELLGVADVTASGDMLVRMNTTGGAVDESIETGGEPIKIVFEEGEGDLKRVEISGEISVADFFSMSGNFALETNSRNFTLKDDTLLQDADLFTIGGSEGTAFAGVNGPADNESALGLYITEVEFGIAIVTPKTPDDPATQADKRTWTALKAKVGAAKFIGVDDMVVSFDDFYVAVNTGSGEDADGNPNNTVVNFTSGDALDVNTGGGSTISLDFDSKVMEMRGSLTLGVFGFFYIDGGFAIKKSETTVILTDGDEVEVNYLSIGGHGVEAFAGINGPADNESALGFSLTEVNFAIVFMKAVVPADPGAEPNDLRSWTAVTAEVGTFEFVGIDDLDIDMSISDFKLKLNKGGGEKDGDPNETVVDFKEMEDQGRGFTIPTGDTSEITFHFAEEFLGVEATVSLDVFGFFYVSGSFAFEKTEGEVLLSSGELQKVDLMTVGASDVFAFAGVNGPYFTDLDGNGEITPNDLDNDDEVIETHESDELSDSALGFSLEQVDFALAFIKPEVSEDIGTNPADKRTWISLKAKVGTARLVGIDNVTVAVEDFYVGLNTGGGSFGGIDNTTFIDFSGFPLEVNTGGGNSLTLDFNSDILQAYGTITLEIYDFFFVTGSFGFTKKSMTVTLNDAPASEVEVEALTLGGADVSGFAGVNGPETNDGAMGFYLQDMDFALAMMTRKKDDAAPLDKRTWTSLKATVGKVSIIGIEGITISMDDFAIALNQSGGKNNDVANEDVVDYSATDLEVETGGDPITFDFVDELLEARGTMALAVYGFFFVTGSFSFQKKRSLVQLDDGSDPLEAELITVGVKDVTAFAGVNGPADQPGALGLSMVNADFALAMIKPSNPGENDTRSWMAVYAYVETAEFIGVDGLTMSVTEISVQVNQGRGTLNDIPNETIVDFTRSDFDHNGNLDEELRVWFGSGPEDYLDINYSSEFIQAEATVDLDIFGYVYLSGTFAFEKSETTVTLDDGSSVPVQLITVGGHVDEAFAGVNGPGSNEGAMGLSLTGVDFGMAMMRPNLPTDPEVEPTDLRSWTALRADVDSAKFVGVEEGLTIEISEVYVAINQGRGRLNNGANRTVVDFSTYDNDDLDPVDGYLEVNVGGGKTVQIDFAEEFIKVQGKVELGIYDFFFVNGNFGFEKSSTVVTLSDGTSQEMEVISVGASDVNGFAGVNGPYFTDLDGNGEVTPNASDNGDGVIETDESDELNEEALGLVLTDVDFALAFFKAKGLSETTTDQRSWITVKASVGEASFVGVEGLTIGLRDFSVKVNQSGGKMDGIVNDTVIDFTGEAFPVNIGGGKFIDLDFKTELLAASGSIELGIYNFFFVSGNFAFQKSETTVTVRDITTGAADDVPVQLLTLGASGVDAFAGVNGPADNEGALGFALEDVEFALTLMKRKKDTLSPGDTRSWVSLAGDVGDARFIGLDDMTLSVSSIHVGVNQSGGKLDGADNNTYVDFSQYDDDGNGEADGYMTVETGPGDSIQLDFHEELIQVEAKVEMNLFGFFYLSGTFAFEKSNATVSLDDPAEEPVQVEMFTIGAASVEAFAGVNGPAEEPGAIGLSLKDVDLAIVIMKARAPSDGSQPTDKRTWTAVQGRIGEASLVGIDDVQLELTNFWVLVNQGGGEKAGVDNTTVVDFKQSAFDADGDGVIDGFLRVNTGDGNYVDVDLDQRIIKVDGHLTMYIQGHGLEGDFTFEQTTNETGGKVMKVAVANVDISFLSGEDETAIITVTNIHGTLVINSTGMAGELSMDVGFNPDLGSINIDAEATVNLAINTSTEAIYEEIEIQGDVQVIDLPAGPYLRVAAYDVVLSFPGPVDIRGDFQFEAITIDGVKYVRIAAANVYVNLLGKGEITDGYGGMIFSNKGVAGILKGNVTLDPGYGIEGEGDASFQINTTKGEVNQVITVQGTEIRIEFTTPEQYDFVDFAVTNATLKFGDYVQLTGDYKMGTEGELKLVGAKNVTLFLGDGPYEIVDVVEKPDGTTTSTKVENPNAVGVLVKNARLGVVMFPDKSFALIAEGEAALVGVDGLNISGRITARVNNSGQAVTKTITIPDDPGIEVSFDSSGKVEEFSGELEFGVAGVFTLSGLVRFTRLPNGVLQVDIPLASLLVFAGGKEVVGISGAAAFSLGGGQGFKMENLRLQGFSLFGVGVGVKPGTSAAAFPSARLVTPVSNGAIDAIEINVNNRYIDVVFTDPNGVGLTNIDGNEFILAGAAARNVKVVGTPEQVIGTTYRYSFQGDFTEGEVEVKFQGNTWSDTSGNNNLALTERFTVSGGPRAPPPAATLSNPKNGEVVAVTMLNARKYIDITFVDRSGTGLSTDSITDSAAEIRLSGPGVADALLGAQGALDVSPIHVSGTTYRYLITDKDPTNDIAIFTNGEVIVSFIANSFEDNGGGKNAAVTEKFTIKATGAGAGATDKPLKLGPLTLQGPTIGLTGFSFKDKMLNLTIGIGVEVASLSFGGNQSSSGIKAEVVGLLGTFDLSVNVLAIIGAGDGPVVSAPGKFSISCTSLDIEVPNLLKANATGIKIGYDPSYDPAEHGGQGQELVVIDSVSVSIIPLKITGSIKPYVRPSGERIPGLVVRETGFALGVAELCYGCVGGSSATADEPGKPISLFGIIEFDDIRVGITDFAVDFRKGIKFDGEIYFASGGARFFPGKPISATISDRISGEPLDNTEALRAAITFSDGKVDDFVFEVDTFEIKFASFLTIKAVDFELNTGARGQEELVSFLSVGAELIVGSCVVGGDARNFAFLGDGTFLAKKGFGVFLNAEAADGSKTGWPSFLPIKITQLGIEWDDINVHPEDFIITISASVTSMKGVPGLQFSGTIEGLKIHPRLLFEGKFPILDIASFGVSVKGDLFGGTIDAALIGGIIKLDANDNMIDALDSTTPVADRVLFLGVQGGFEMPGLGGLTIRFALSELGPLGVFLNISVPGGVILEPNTGLAINDFAAGVEFFKTLPDIEDPRELAGAAFGLPTETTAETWLSEIKQQVVLQYKKTKNLPPGLGFLAAFTSPMTITGSCKVYTAYASDATFNGQVLLKLSTDGKFLMNGRLNFAADKISISAKIYADLSKVLQGRASVMFLAELPAQVKILNIYGKLSMGFRNDDGDPVDIPPVIYEEVVVDMPTADLASPAHNDQIDIVAINDRKYKGQYYIDVTFRPGEGNSLDYATILDDKDDELELLVAGAVVEVSDIPIPISFSVDEDGLPVTTEVLIEADESPEEYHARLAQEGITQFRYIITQSGFEGFDTGQVEVTFIGASFSTTGGLENEEKTESFVVAGTTARVDNPATGSSVDISELNGRNYIDVSFPDPPTGYAYNLDSIFDPEAEFTLSGPGLGDVKLDQGQQPVQISDTKFRYWVNGTFSQGEVTAEFLPGAWSLVTGAGTAPPDITVTVDDPVYMEVTFPDPPDGYEIDPGSITDSGDEFTLTSPEGVDLKLLPIEDPIRIEESNTYKYRIEGEFAFDDTGEAIIPVEVTISFIDQSWSFSESEEVERSRVLGDLSPTNDRTYMDVTFYATGDSELDEDTILDFG